MHRQAYEWFEATLRMVPTPGRVVEFGARNINGSLRTLLVQTEDYVGTDVEGGPGVDVVAAGQDYTPEVAPDMVVCAEVLEHVPDDVARGICQNALRILAPGGHFLVSMAAAPRFPHSAVDGGRLKDGEFYRNVTKEQLSEWLVGFEAGLLHYHQHGDLYAVTRKARAEPKLRTDSHG